MLRLPKKIFNKDVLPHFALITTAIIWGIAGPIVKLTLDDLPVFTFLLYRFLIVCIVLLPYLFIELKRDPVHKKDFLNIVILSIASQVSIAFIFLGLKFSTALDSAVIGILAPILTFIAGAYFYREKTTKMEELGIGLAVLGTMLVVVEPVLTKNHSTQISERIFGNMLILAYQFSWPVYIILSKMMLGQNSKNTNKAVRFLHLTKFHKKYKPSTITLVSFYIGLAFFIPMALIERQINPTPIDFTSSAIIGILYMGLLSSIVAYGLYQWAVKYLEAQETASYAYITSVFTIPAAFLLLGEVPTQTMVIGAVIISIGVIIAEKYKS